MIEQHTIDGREAKVAYLHPDFSPATRDVFAIAKVIFDDGKGVVFISNPDYDHSAVRPPIEIPPEDTDPYEYEMDPEPEEIPVKLQLVAWAKAIMILDASEVLIRDLIERELYGRTGTTTGPTALLVARQLSAKIGEIRQEAIKTAFRALRSWLGDVPILDISLARWAQSFAVKDAKGIDIAIQTGLIAGFDNTEIARKVVGSMGLNGVDGVTEFTRHKIAHLGRAAIKESALRRKESQP